jgi:hypothetical protein
VEVNQSIEVHDIGGKKLIVFNVNTGHLPPSKAEECVKKRVIALEENLDRIIAKGTYTIIGVAHPDKR